MKGKENFKGRFVVEKERKWERNKKEIKGEKFTA